VLTLNISSSMDKRIDTQGTTPNTPSGYQSTTTNTLTNTHGMALVKAQAMPPSGGPLSLTPLYQPTSQKQPHGSSSLLFVMCLSHLELIHSSMTQTWFMATMAMRTLAKSYRLYRTTSESGRGSSMPAAECSTPQCSWTPFIWNYNHLGHACLTTIPSDPKNQFYASDLSGNKHTQWINKPMDAVCLLGVHIAADGNYEKELCILKQKQQKYVQFLLCTPLSKQEAQVIYKQCYLLMVTYPLPATNMPPSKIYDTQCSVTSLFLTRMGYPRHLPRCIVYAPETVGGLGMRHLGYEQGMQQTLQLLRHLRANTTNGKLYSFTIDQYQIYARTHQPILEDTKDISWILKGWISSIHEFLHTTNSQILLQHSWTPTEK